MTPSSALASVLVDELVRGGVTDVVLSPGSRSAPLAYAVLAVERTGRLRLHVRVDERSAGFLALGLARGSGRPAVLVTTSGTAVANLHPAVLEAHHGGVPLVVLSADRPHELRGSGANQTTSQPGIFGPAVRFEADLPAVAAVPASGEPVGAWWRSSVCRALVAARGDLGAAPGPVHLDVAFREPLVPEEDRALPEHLAGRPGGQPWVAVAPVTSPAAPALEDLERTLVVVGDGVDGDAALAWATARGYPVVAEPFAGPAARAASLPHGPLLLSATDWLVDHAPERVVVVGRVTLARPVAALLRRPGVRVEVVTRGSTWPDPSHLAAQVHPWSALAAHDEPAARPAPRGPWARAWDEAGRRVAEAVAARGFPWPSGLAVAATVDAALPDDGVLVVGSSNPVRDLDLASAGRPGSTTRVLANRGLAGIDGIVSTATGVALGAGRPTHALLGDLTFLHDAGGLLVGPDEPRPDLTLVVVNDDGGGIFTTLEPGAPQRSDAFERVFATPTGTDLAALCRAHGADHEVVRSAQDLARLVGATPRGVRVLEVPVERSSHRQAHADLRDLAVRAVSTG
ncbi:2-succinyl-5-enolpyruvyl-6-hydroxy-3-cyclohexene-1-carboxylic-acid synthase [Phycicoccus endophyticus]|uniref:2-succinyl-5-enolpyruvyl-6-hydroxy-3- cyclohexene-1-carboxylic-acid synthase n=1 Tax=Phycicoccus endophyticus TaxID=1690220 RepID=UPI00140DF3A7|nr:2-succinyl-5-enolpyruvyl-6-hydroxy-3-cyclohexene-1-carboxylic-acid synthase [Phycicoccus endophyticus]NHI19120.1 2-succinyl-5-enolpyruvyl-6-hydroxy-3-cyclohexene-1-carboxylic-acid synthase [Phycicoccus endophyticus]GGL32937.1 2-succinyl-5-enolpyruvyl-6-hydroxy-3-cyclohexene-1-carboxylate synthase [Phycicoccus endophyticus]